MRGEALSTAKFSLLHRVLVVDILLPCKLFRVTVLKSIRGVSLGYIQQYMLLCCGGTSIVHSIMNV